jgi:uncharacterized glyoxalase superfamily protein PhnB
MGATRVVPIYTANDLEKSVAWYRDVLGCEVGQTFEEEGKLVGAALEYGQVGFWFGQDDFAKGRDRQKGEGFRIILETEEDVDALAAGIKDRGGELLTEPEDQPWGVRMFAIADPDGFKISISTPVEKEK